MNRAAVVLMASLLLWMPVSALSQAGGERGRDEQGTSPSAEQQEIDREEAEFRRRMELEEKDDDRKVTPSRPLPEIVDVEPVKGPLDHLPPASREHLEKQITELIIGNGRWEPADAAREAPYEPSKAAQADPALAAAEQAAFGEMVAAYHAREAAAQGQGAGTSGGSQGMDSGQGSGEGADQGAGGSGAGPEQGGGSPGTPDSAPPPGASERAPQDAASNALEFLRQQGHADAGDEVDVGAEVHAGAETEAEAGTGAEVSAGSAERGAGEAAESTAEEDGSIPVAALGSLFGEKSGQETESAPATQPAADADVPQAPEADEPAREDTLPTPPAQPEPENGLLAWLRRLFGA